MLASLDILDGKTALVTGAGRGLGRAVALSLALAGAQVALVARSAGELAGTADRVRELGAKALVIPADVGDPGQLSAAASRARDELGDVDVLINNAAVVAPLGASTSHAAHTGATMITVPRTGHAGLMLSPGRQPQHSLWRWYLDSGEDRSAPRTR